MIKYSIEDIKSEVFSELVSVITTSINEKYNEVMTSLDLETKNCQYFLLWDTLQKALIRELGYNFLKSLKKRGIWQLALIYDPESKTIFSLMKEKRFRELQRNQKKRKVAHYLDGLVELNSDLSTELSKGKLFDFDDSNIYIKEEALKILNLLCTDFMDKEKKIVANHVLICFDNYNGFVTSLKAYVLDNQLDIIETKDLSEFITLDIGTIESHFDKQRNTSPKINLTSKSIAKLGKKPKTKLKPNENIEEQL